MLSLSSPSSIKLYPLVRVVKTLYGDHPSLPSISVYFQGCDAFPKCIGCHNPETWDFDESFKVDFSHLFNTVVQKLELLLTKHSVVSLALLGGEPLSERNRESAYLLAKHVKEKYKERVKVIVYTWRMPVDLLNVNVPLDYFDEFVLGRYMKKYHTGSFPASANQMYITKDELFSVLEDLKKGEEKVCQSC